MKTNELKKGDRVLMSNGWYGTVADNMRGNTRMVEVSGDYTEIGSVYSHDIIYAVHKNGTLLALEHTPAQLKLKSKLSDMGW